MQEVGEYLQDVLQSNLSRTVNREAFARTAYNRYYYACYLYVKQELRKMNDQWVFRSHQNVPKVLMSHVSKEFMRMRDQAKSTGDKRFYGQINDAISSATEIASTLSTAFSIRIVADYKPEISVEFRGRNEIRLENISIATAREWFMNITSHMSLSQKELKNLVDGAG